jgi:hypothetical protein
VLLPHTRPFLSMETDNLYRSGRSANRPVEVVEKAYLLKIPIF